MDSQVIINTMEVLETKPLNELVTEATVKVCYVSETQNPNLTVINKEVGKEIAATLPGAPVVGLFDPETNDFVEHSRKLTVKNGEIKWEDLTKPYGFVSPIHKPWYQDFIENGEKRTYLMCKAFLWTRQYKEASLIPGKGQSMELNEQEMSGYYEGDVFIFTHTVLDKLCILGDKYAPCFEGAQFLTTYAKEYSALTDEIENLIGKRYYVLNDKLVEKPISLDYAIQLGWNLEDAIYQKLMENKTELDYRIAGIFAENDSIFAILQEKSTQTYFKISLKISDKDTVILGSEMTPVSMKWTPKDEDTITANTFSEQIPASIASTMQTENKDLNSTEISPEQAAEPINESADPATDFSAEANSEPASSELTTENADTSSENAENSTIDFSAESQENQSGEMNADVAEHSENTVEPSEGEASTDPEPQLEPNAEFSALTDKISLLEKQLEEKTTYISQLESQLQVYHQKEKEAENMAKNEMVASYKLMLSEEEMKPVTDNLADFSLEEVESKLSITYARKQRATLTTPSNIQLNINSTTTEDDDNLPEFMKQAAEYDRIRSLNFNI